MMSREGRVETSDRAEERRSAGRLCCLRRWSRRLFGKTAAWQMIQTGRPGGVSRMVRYGSSGVGKTDIFEPESVELLLSK